MNKIFCFILIILFSFNFSKAQLTANFSSSITSGCAPLVVQFTDLSTGGATSWNWTFGNGNSSPNQNPQAIYTNPGVYTVQLAVSNGSTISTKTKTITVYNKPVANFNINPNPTITAFNKALKNVKTAPVGNNITWNYFEWSY